MAVVITEAMSARFDGRMMVSALLITLPNSLMYCSATRSWMASVPPARL